VRAHRRRTGLPPLTINRWFPITNFPGLIKLAIIVWIIDLLESTSIARALAMKNGYKLNVTQVGGLAAWGRGR
jgi:sulfate transporter 4